MIGVMRTPAARISPRVIFCSRFTAVASGQNLANFLLTVSPYPTVHASNRNDRSDRSKTRPRRPISRRKSALYVDGVDDHGDRSVSHGNSVEHAQAVDHHCHCKAERRGLGADALSYVAHRTDKKDALDTIPLCRGCRIKSAVSGPICSSRSLDATASPKWSTIRKL